MKYRVYWNITKGSEHPWIIDRGDNSQRVWVKGFRIVSCTGNSVDRINGHPRGWFEIITSKLEITKDGYASFY